MLFTVVRAERMRIFMFSPLVNHQITVGIIRLTFTAKLMLKRPVFTARLYRPANAAVRNHLLLTFRKSFHFLHSYRERSVFVSCRDKRFTLRAGNAHCFPSESLH